jgi:microcin C transport system permease protein
MPLLLILLSLFGWLGIADYIRSECLKIKQLDYIKQAQIMGLPSWRILLKHVLPNVLSPILAFLPFRISAGILAISTLDFLGLGLPLMPSIGDLLNQSKNNLEAWWILLPTMFVLVSITLSLSLVGNGLRKASGSKI